MFNFITNIITDPLFFKFTLTILVAYGLAIAAKAHAEAVIKLASTSWQAKVQADPRLRYGMTLRKLETWERILKMANVTDPQLDELIARFKDALQRGEYDLLPLLLIKIRRRLIHDIWSNGAKLRGRLLWPVGKGRGGLKP